MNVKQGDMAYVVGADFERDNGLVVQVLKLAPARYAPNGAEWECKPCYPCFSGEAVGSVFITPIELSAENVDIPDAWLRPIRPPETPVTETRDEELTV